jgi:RNA-directed DNA polymerase
MAALSARLAECGLRMHPDKTQIVYCKDGSRKGKDPNVKFDFFSFFSFFIFHFFMDLIIN